MSDWYARLFPLLRRLPPESAHRLALVALERGLVPAPLRGSDPILRLRAFGRELANPLGLAAGFDKDAVAVAALFRLIDSMKAFPHIFIMTSGGPGKVTEATNFFAYLQAYSYSFIGFSSAIVVLMVIFVFGLSMLLIRMVGTEVEIE